MTGPIHQGFRMYIRFPVPEIFVIWLVLFGLLIFRLVPKKGEAVFTIGSFAWVAGMACLFPGALWIITFPGLGSIPGIRPGKTEVPLPSLIRESSGPRNLQDSNPLSGHLGGPLQSLVLGSLAPDFTLPSVETGQLVHLGALLQQKPVVLVFGSFGCAYFCSRLDRVKDLQQRYGDRADFLFVYIDNQHAEPEPLQSAIADVNAPLDAPVNQMARIRAGLDYYGLSIPCVIDSKNNKVHKDYKAFPARLVIVDQKQKVAFDSGSVLQSGLNPKGAAVWLEEHPSTTKIIPKSRPMMQ
jgi:hypothetical protein